jgi:hypothetical protein
LFPIPASGIYNLPIFLAATTMKPGIVLLAVLSTLSNAHQYVLLNFVDSANAINTNSLTIEPRDVALSNVTTITIAPFLIEDHHHHPVDAMDLTSSMRNIESQLSALSASMQDLTTHTGYGALGAGAAEFLATATHESDADSFLVTQTYVTGEPLTRMLSLGADIISLQSLYDELTDMAQTLTSTSTQDWERTSTSTATVEPMATEVPMETTVVEEAPTTSIPAPAQAAATAYAARGTLVAAAAAVIAGILAVAV